MSILGTRVARIEDPRPLTAGGTYAADLRDPRLEGAVHATYVRSTMALALLGGVDVDEALALPGVVDVVTGADVDLAPIPGMTNAAMAQPYLAVGRVRFAGEQVAVVLTERPEQGPDAAEQVIVDYEPLPAVVDPVDALAVDLFAAKIGMDAAEVRRRNLVPRFDEPHTTPPVPPMTAATSRRRSIGCWRRPATTTCGPSSGAGASRATGWRWASACRPTSR